MQAKSATNIKGIDVSRWQGTIDWAKVAESGVKFAFIKATQGLSWVDPMLKKNAAGAKAAGILVSYYHFAEPEKSAADQVAHFVKTVSTLPEADFPLILDIETTKWLSRSEIHAFTLSFMQELEKRTNRVPILYTGASFAKSYLGKELSRYPLWVAHYGVEKPMSNTTWEKWAVFQYSDKGSVPGIVGPVDLNAMEADFMPYMMSEADGKKLVGLLKALWTMENTKFMDISTYYGEDVTKEDIEKLADAVRAAAGLPKE